MKTPAAPEGELWRRVADAQDAAVVDAQTWRALERGVAARVAATDRGIGLPGLRARTPRQGDRFTRRALDKLRRSRTLAAVLGTSLLASAAAAVLLHGALRDRPGAAPRLLISTERNKEAPTSGRARASDQAAEKAFVADARSDLPLRFTDGSVVIFRAGSAGRMQRLTHSGAEIVLERGWLEAHVVHADTTLWLVHAGPFRVRVTGTRFAMTWAGASFELDLYQGAVVIDGSVLGAGVPLRAGQRLRVASGVVLIEPLAAGGQAAGSAPTPAPGPATKEPETPAPGEPGAATAKIMNGGEASFPAKASPEIAGPAPRGAGVSRPDRSATSSERRDLGATRREHGQRLASRGGRGGAKFQRVVPGDDGAGTGGVALTVTEAAHGTGSGFAGSEHAVTETGESGSGMDDWSRLAERGMYRDAFAAAKRAGWNALCNRLDARRLLTLGDVARYSGARVEASQAFQAVVTRFPEDRLAADAVFSLGRLAFESGRPGEATRWFRRYIADWPDAPLADQAAGRLVECAVRAEDRPEAQAAARRYLTRAPRGPHATLAREVLAEPAEVGAPSPTPPRLSPPESRSRSVSPVTSGATRGATQDDGRP